MSSGIWAGLIVAVVAFIAVSISSVGALIVALVAFAAFAVYMAVTRPKREIPLSRGSKGTGAP
jgi:hypothetical protein